MNKKTLIGILIGICGVIILCFISSNCSSYFCCYCFDLICIETGYREIAKDSQKIAEIHKIQVALEMYYQMHGYYPGISGKNSWKETKEILIKENLLAPRDIFYEPEYWVSKNKKKYVLKILLSTHREELNEDIDGYPFGRSKVWCGKNGEKEREYCISNTTNETYEVLKKIIKEKLPDPKFVSEKKDYYLGCKINIFAYQIWPHNIAGPSVETIYFGELDCPLNIENLSLEKFAKVLAEAKKEKYPNLQSGIVNINSKKAIHHYSFETFKENHHIKRIFYEQYIFKIKGRYIVCAYKDEGKIEKINLDKFLEIVYSF